MAHRVYYAVSQNAYAEIEIQALVFGVPDQLTLSSSEQSTMVN